MKALATLILLICSIQFCQAQLVVNAYDNDGKLIGQPELDPKANRLMVIRPDSIAVIVDFTNGEVVDNTRNDIVFAELDCQGQAYNVTGSQPFNWISTYASDTRPQPLFLFMQDSKGTSINVQSWATSDSPGCMNGPGFSLVYPVTLITDPTQYGFIPTPRGGWGYAPPLKMKAVTLRSANDAMFCNSFEGCPTE